MPIEYVNRKGDRYFLLQGKTKTGKPKYYAARRPGLFADEMPEGYEFYEHPEQAIVSVRKIPTTAITAQEREALTALARSLVSRASCIVDIEDDSLIVYAAEGVPTGLNTALSRLLPLEKQVDAAKLLGKFAIYQAMLRFTLIDAETRSFAVDRWCFRGSIDDWFPLGGGKDLETLARRFLPHLGKESFFELM
jgi:hypothetical protein